MKTALLALAVSLAATLHAQSPQLVKKWESEATLKTPESVLFDAGGKVIAAEWVKGLHAPKGMALHKGRLHVADIDRMIVIDVAKGAIAETIPIEGTQQLNDVTADKAGVVYVSDMKGLKIYALTNGKPAVWAEGFKRPNGLLAHGDDLYVLDSGTLIKIGKDKKRTTIVEGMDASTDGIEHVKGNEFIVSCWAGAVYHVKGSEKHLLLDTREKKLNSADIGYDAKTRMVYVPTFFANTVVAYELK